MAVPLLCSTSSLEGVHQIGGECGVECPFSLSNFAGGACDVLKCSVPILGGEAEFRWCWSAGDAVQVSVGQEYAMVLKQGCVLELTEGVENSHRVSSVAVVGAVEA